MYKSVGVIANYAFDPLVGQDRPRPCPVPGPVLFLQCLSLSQSVP